MLAYLKEFRNTHGPHLVIVPKSTLGNWVREFNRWCPSFTVIRVQGPKAERKEQILELLTGKYEVVVTSFETLILEKATFRKFPWW